MRTFSVLLFLFAFFTAPLSAQQYSYYEHLDADSNPNGIKNDPDGVDTSQGWDRIWTVNGPWSYSNTWSEVDTIPFPFEFNGQSSRYFMASISGVVTFDTTLGSYETPNGGNLAIPTADHDLPGQAVMAWGLSATNLGAPSRIATKTYGTAPNRQHWVTFDRFEDEDDPNPDSLVWSIVFEEGTNKIYVVDQRNLAHQKLSMTVGIQIDSNNALQVAGSPNIQGHAQDDPSPSNNAYYEFVPSSDPQRDMRGHEPAMPRILHLSNAPFNVGGAFRNHGNNDLNSLDVHYRIDGGSVQTLSFNGMSIAPNQVWQFSGGNFDPSSPGVYNMEMWCSNINGGNDQVPSNDTLSFKVNVVETSYVRNTLIESFSSSHCDPCDPANSQYWNNIRPQISNYAFIKYPTFDDPYETPQAHWREDYYGVNAFPTYKFDGQYETNYIYGTTEFDDHQAEPSYFDIEFTKAVYEGDSVEVRANIHSLVDGEYTYHVAIIEKLTTGNVGSNGATEFHNVMMKMMPKQGTERYLHRDQPNPIIKTGDMSGTYVEEMSDLKAVVFVQNERNKHVMQAGWTDIQSGNVATSVEEEEQTASLKLYPNPVEDKVRLESELLKEGRTMVRIRDLQGRTVRKERLNKTRRQSSLNVSGLKNGLYMVEIRGEKERVVRKMLVR